MTNQILEGLLLKKYKEYSTWLQNRNLEKIALSNLKSEKEYAQAHFFNEELNHEFLKGFINSWEKKDLNIYPI